MIQRFVVAPISSVIFLDLAFCDDGTPDLMILGMAFPNPIGVVLLSGKVKTMLDDYLARLRAGAFDVASAASVALELDPAVQHDGEH